MMEIDIIVKFKFVYAWTIVEKTTQFILRLNISNDFNIFQHSSPSY